MIGTIGTAMVGLAMSLNVAMSDVNVNFEHWECLGECRITEYCPSCNDGNGHDSTSGIWLESGHAACSWLPNGTIISIDGVEFKIVDTCGTDAIDLFRETEVCQCDMNEYKVVYIKRKGFK